MSTTLWVNGVSYTIDNVHPKKTLNEFIRESTPLKGTKVSCNEGGCGACAVMISFKDELGKDHHRSVNSCLRPLAACNNMHVTTVEGLGSTKTGLHPIQERIAAFNGTQCGYCTPGMVMSFFDLLTRNPEPTAAEVEAQLDGNMCRCTGYRPILDAFQSFSKDFNSVCEEQSAHKHNIEGLPSIEERPKCCGSCVKPIEISSKLPAPCKSKPRSYVSGDAAWFDATSLAMLTALIKSHSSLPYKLVCGSTGDGVERYYKKRADPTVYINISQVPELLAWSSTGMHLVVGACVTLNDLIALLENTQKVLHLPNNHFTMAASHLQRIAGQLVRNVGSVVGNLMLHYYHHANDDSFPSDAWCVLSGLGATLNIVDTNTNSVTPVTFDQFLNYDMQQSFVGSLSIPICRTNQEVFRSYKTAIRRVNAHAYVNAAIRATVDPQSNVASNATVVVGGVKGATTRLPRTEAAINGIQVTSLSAFQQVVSIMNSELSVNPIKFPGNGTKYRIGLAINYLYKFFLALQPNLPSNLQLAAEPWIPRKISHGNEAYQNHPETAPVGIGTPKISAKAQASGEALYTGDVPTSSQCLMAAFAISTVPGGKISVIDTTVAAAMPGVFKILTAADLDPLRNFWSGHILLASGKVTHIGQPLAIVLADTQADADRAALAVQVSYTDIEPGLFTVAEAIANQSFHVALYPNLTQGDVTTAFKNAAHTISGTVAVGQQYHYTMETQTAYCTPTESGLQVYAASQMLEGVQASIHAATGVPLNNINVECRRCGGGYGGKITYSSLPATAVAVASVHVNRPVKMVTDINTNTAAFGYRPDTQFDYSIAIDSNNMIIGVKGKIYANVGAENVDGFELNVLRNNLDGCYNIPNWDVAFQACKTNLPAACTARGPGWTTAAYFSEYLVSTAAKYLNIQDRDAYRESMFYQKGGTTPSGGILRYFNMQTIWAQIQNSAEWAARKVSVAEFNANNLFRKRGLALHPVKFAVGYEGARYGMVTVHQDGTVSVASGGIEIGQGLDTKCQQRAALELGCPLELIQYKAATTDMFPKSQVTGGSVTSEQCSNAIAVVCQTVKQSLMAARKALAASGNKNPTWKEVAAFAHTLGLPMTEKKLVTWDVDHSKTDGKSFYMSYCAGAMEVEVDTLTGETMVRRMDILFDCGYSLNPVIDIGQVQGAFMMGLGLFWTEQRDYRNGVLFQNGTFEYKPPSALDIPEVFNVALLPNAPNPVGVLSSKAVGEPPLCLGSTIFFAVEDALSAVRKQVVSLEAAPVTPDVVQDASTVSSADFVF